MHPAPPSLLALAAAHGVATDYWDWRGEHQPVSASTLRQVLAALGVAAHTDADVEQSLEESGIRSWRRVLPPIVVLREGWTPWVAVHLPHGHSMTVTVELESGEVRPVGQVDHWVDPREVDGVLTGEATVEIPGDLPLGWHTLHAVLQDGTEARTALVVAPQRLRLPAELAEGRVWGLLTQLYQVRSERSWGVGDLADLAALCEWTRRELDGGFVLVNPLHAAEPSAPMEPSPYLPTSRRFANPLYLRVEDLAGFADLPAGLREEVHALARPATALNRSDRIDRDTSWRAKRAALWLMFQVRSDDEGLDAYIAEQGEPLRLFATWCTLVDVLGGRSRYWPVELRSPDDPAVAEFAAEHDDQVRFHSWLQWQLEQQLASVQQIARASGMALGVIHDLAVGVHPEGADAWALQRVLARGVTVGAPPDEFNQLGQNWSQPPWHPERLAELGYAPYRDMIRALLKDSGGLRIDHVIGLFRLWWVPDGASPAEGAYVRYDFEAMVSILVLEAHRAGAVVIGEDLGVVEPFMRDFLGDRGILGTSVAWFEWVDGRPRPAEQYRELCLATLTTHDLIPTAGYLDLDHVQLREKLELLTRPAELERADQEAAIAGVREMLVERGLMPVDADNHAMVLALHRFLAATPSRMLGVALTDLVGDRRVINQPGTHNEYPNWRLPLAGPDGTPILLEDLTGLDLPARIAACLSED